MVYESSDLQLDPKKIIFLFRLTLLEGNPSSPSDNELAALKDLFLADDERSPSPSDELSDLSKLDLGPPGLLYVCPDGTYQPSRPPFFIDPRYDGSKTFEQRLKEYEEELEDERRWLEDYERYKARHEAGLDDDQDFPF